MFLRLAYFSLIIIAFIINYPQAQKAGPVVFAKSSVQVASYPFVWGGKFIIDKTEKAARFIVNSRSFEKYNLSLKSQLKENEARLLLLEALRSENNKLREAIGFKSSNPYGSSLMLAEVISFSGSAVILNRGKRDGVVEGQTVVNESGLVGKILEVYPFSSKVLLITDPSSVVSAVLPKSGTYGVMRGGAHLTMDYVPEGISVEAGEKVLVSSASLSYIRGVPIGFVRSAGKRTNDLFQKIEVNPAASLSKLGLVYLCR